MSTAPSARCRASSRATPRGSRSTRPRSCTGVAAPSAQGLERQPSVRTSSRRLAVSESENPAIHAPEPKPTRPHTNRDWWPNQPELGPLRQTGRETGPYGEGFDYRKAFAGLDLEALKRDVVEVMTTSQDWWPADYGHYG